MAIVSKGGQLEYKAVSNRSVYDAFSLTGGTNCDVLFNSLIQHEAVNAKVVSGGFTNIIKEKCLFNKLTLVLV